MKSPDSPFNSITTNDLQILSAYLDNQLGVYEREGLEKRLMVDEMLLKHLEGLRRTRAILRAVPPRKVPHNFYLTRSMAMEATNIRSRLRWFSALRFSSALAIFTAFLMLFFQSLSMSTPVLTSNVSQKVVLQNIESSQENISPTGSPPPIIIWEPQFSGKGGGGMGGGGNGGDAIRVAPPASPLGGQVVGNEPTGMGGGGDNSQPKEPGHATEITVTPDIQTGRAEESLPQSTPFPQSEQPPSTASAPLPTSTQISKADSSTSSGNSDGIILGLPSVEDAGKITIPQQEEGPVVRVMSQQPVEDMEGMVYFPIGVLIAVSICSGLAAWIIWKRI